MTRLVAVAGSAPGIGKSTLCAALAGWLTGSGRRVDHFREEDMYNRPAFAPLVEEFTGTGVVRLSTLLVTTTEYVRTAAASGYDVVLTDSLIPFTHSVLAWGHDEQTVTDFLADLAARLAPFRPVLVYLDGDPGTALLRAAEREERDEPGWLDWFVGKLTHYQVTPAVTDLGTAITYLRHERELTLRLLRAQSWQLIVIERADELAPADIEATARRLLRSE